MDKGTDMTVLDSRPMDEFRKMSIPGGIDCPGAELVYRFYDTVPSPETLVVVNCAGRTRSIIGAQSLINAGVPNRVVALKDGTMGWHLAGLALAAGETRHAPAPSHAGLAKARAAAERLADRCGVRLIGAADLDAFRCDPSRTLYLFDVRTPEEYRAGHRPGARSAPGGQLVQATDAYMATRNARVALYDSDGVRARMTASWLTQMGLPEVYVLEDGGALDETGPEPRRVLGLTESVATISAAALAPLIENGNVILIDLATSLDYRAQHIPGAWFAIRSRFAAALPRLPAEGPLVLTSPDGVLARLAAPELRALTDRAVRVLDGGTAAWRAAGLPLAAGAERMADEAPDVWHRPYDRSAGAEEAMKAYLGWEINLLRQIEREPAARFRALAGD
jgi:rhodanese-related sulfurtransferase